MSASHHPLFYNTEVHRLRKEISPHAGLVARIRQARALMQQDFHRPLTVTELAAVACLSPFHFLRSFKRLYGQTPHRALMDIRIREAKKLLREGRSIGEVCWATGFSSPTSFATLFRRYGGISPRSWQVKNR